MKRIRIVLPALLLVAVLLLNACGLGSPTATVSAPPAAAAQPTAQKVIATQQSSAPFTTTTAVSVAGAAVDLQTTYSTIYDQVNPSVVNIQVTLQPASSSRFNFRVAPQPTTGQASGFVWDAQGDIVTNNHVVNGATTIQVTFYDDVTVSAKLVGADPDSDLAVIRIDPSLHDLVPVKVADFQTLKVGQIVLAIGNPFGLNGTLTAGIISAMGRELPVDNSNSTGTTTASYSIPDVIQTDAAINPGNSGGPLLNINGEVVGVNTAIESNGGSSSGVGFAVPVAIVQRVVPGLIKDGSYHHPWLGVTVTTLSPEVAQAMNLPANQRGALVVGVTQGSPSQKAGLVASAQTAQINGQSVDVGGDVIVQIDGKAVTKSEDLISYLVRETFVGQEVTLTVLRDGKQVTLKAVLEPRPTSGTTPTSSGGSSNFPQVEAA